MSMPARARGAQHNHSASLRPLAAAAVLALGLGLAGCANYETSKPYQPAAGVVTDAPGVKVRNLMLIEQGGTLHLAGTLVPDADDSLTQVSGVALKLDGSTAAPLTISGAKKVALPAEDGTALLPKNITATGDVKAGGNVQLTLTFAKSAPVTATVPVLDPKDVDIAAAGGSASASSSAKATPAAHGSASATPSATPTR